MLERLEDRLWKLSPRSLHELLVKISSIDEFRGWWSALDLAGSSILGGIESRSVATGVGASMWIQSTGSRTGEARSIRRGADIDAGSPGAADYAEVLNAIFEEYSRLSFGEDLMRDLHARLFHRSAEREVQRGEYRTGPWRGGVGKRVSLEEIALLPTTPDRIPDEMKVLTEWVRRHLEERQIHPILVIAGFILEFLSIRPFAHGNGRLSRILMQFLLLQAGYDYMRYAPLDAAVADHWTDFSLALRRSQANRNQPKPDISAWLLTFVEILIAQAAGLRQLVRGRPDERLLSRNQAGVLKLLEKHGEVTNRLICSELGMPRETAKQVLNRLMTLDMVRRVGVGRAVRYYLSVPKEK